MSASVKREKLKAEKEEQETPDIFRDRIRYIEASLQELVNEASRHHTELAARLEFASSTEAARAGTMAEKIAKVQKDIQELELLVYGEPKYLMPGLAKQIQQIDESLKGMRAEREALVNQVKGMSWGLKVVGLTGAGTLLGVLGQVLSQVF